MVRPRYFGTAACSTEIFYRQLANPELIIRSEKEELRPFISVVD
jgi:hypothetical protein